jgi:hypothetical protein
MSANAPVQIQVNVEDPESCLQLLDHLVSQLNFSRQQHELIATAIATIHNAITKPGLHVVEDPAGAQASA